MPSDPIANILGRLEAVKAHGEHQYSARCPGHDDAHASLSVSQGDDGRVLLHCHAGCSTIAICQAVGVRMGELFPSKPGREGKIVTTYDYHDAAGELLYQVVRFVPKAFKQRRPDGKGGWTWKLDGVPKVIYRLPELIAAGQHRLGFTQLGDDLLGFVMFGFFESLLGPMGR